MHLGSLPGHLARRFHQISTALFDVEMHSAGVDLTPVQYAALAAVRDNPGIDQATLAGLIAYDRTTIGGVVDRLVGKGLVDRVVSLADRRARALTITATGAGTIKRAEPAMMRAQERLVKTLNRSEVSELVRLMGKVVEALGEKANPSR